jgi:hypothetical protein
MARIVDMRMFKIHLNAAKDRVKLAKGHLRAWKDKGIKVSKFFYDDSLKQAEEQVAMAELYIKEED